MEFFEKDGMIYARETTDAGSVVEYLYGGDGAKLILRVSTDRKQIAATGTDIATITAQVVDYLEQPQPEPGTVTFDLDGQKLDVDLKDGKATVEVSAALFPDDGTLTIKAEAAGMRGGQLEVSVHE